MIAAASAPTGRDIDPELASLREQMRRHPAHREPDREARVRVAERYLRIERDNAALQKKVAAATNSLARTFDRIVGLLTERGFIRVDRRRSRGDRRRSAAGPDLQRERPFGCRMPAHRRMDGSAGSGVGRRAVGGGLRNARRGRPWAAAKRGGAHRAAAAGADANAAAVGGVARRRAAAPHHAEPRARRRLRRGRSTAGPAAATWSPRWPPPTPRAPVRRCRRGISCAGAGRCSTCWTRSAMPPRSRSCGPPRNARSTRFGAAS